MIGVIAARTPLLVVYFRRLMGKESKIKKYPILRYLSYLVIVSILLTGVSFARYTGASSGNVDATLSNFVCSYEISDASSLIFSNTDFWLELDGGKQSATNTARTVRFDIANYMQSEGRVDRISSVALQSTLRFYAPGDFIGKLAVQVLQADRSTGSDIYRAVTPQYVLGDLIYKVNDVNGKYEQTDLFASDVRTIETNKSVNYSDRTDGLIGEEIAQLEQQLSVTGGFTGTSDEHTGVIRAEAKNGTALSVTSTMQTAHYSVGFMRTETHSGSTEVGGNTSSGTMAPILYIDCEQRVPFYTLDITLPQMYFEAATAQSKTFVLCITVIARTQDNDFAAVWGEDNAPAVIGGAKSWDELLITPSSDDNYTLNDAKVTGYHFMRELPVYDLNSGELLPIGTTSVKVTKTYDYAGGAVLTYEHVAPISKLSGSASVDHTIDFYRYVGGEMSDAEPDYNAVTKINGYESGSYNEEDALYGLCSNNGESGYIWFSELSDDPYYDTYKQQLSRDDPVYVFSEALSKGYSSTLNVLFVQMSENPSVSGGAA